MKQRIIQCFDDLKILPMNKECWLHVKFLRRTQLPNATKIAVLMPDISLTIVLSDNAQDLLFRKNDFYLLKILKTEWENGGRKYIMTGDRYYDLSNKKVVNIDNETENN